MISGRVTARTDAISKTTQYGYDAIGTGVTELSGRTVSYGYDSIYRLTNETISNDPNNVNGAASYTYDPVGNRTQKVSTLPGYPGGLTNYNANDQLSTDTYDNDGNTTASNGVGYAYDFENRMVQAGGGISIVYDGDGNRVAKTVAGLTTKYLVDELNPTGYAQVLEEDDYNSSGPLAARQYVYGLELLSRWDVNTRAAHYYVYDGHGSVRALTDANGNVTDTYDYDAFGNLLHSTGTTPNNYLFAGEQFDPDLNLYYNRARYLNTSTGRFWTMDAFEGDHESPLSLHRYLYAVADPVNRVDPGGNDSYAGIIAAAIGLVVVATIAVLNYAHYTPLLQFDISTAYGLSAARFMADHAEYAARHNTDPEAFRRVFGKADPAVVSANFLVILSALYKPITFERTTFAVCGCIAEAGHGYQPAAITFRVSELFFPLPQVLTTDPFNDPRQISRGGALIHEAAHASLNAGDIGHYYDVFKLDPARALQNADSYRVYAEHIYVTH